MRLQRLVIGIALTSLALTAIAAGNAETKAPAEASKKPAAAAAKQTLKGEVLDLACYTSIGASGAEHASCAKSCISKGMPVGLLVGDTAYLLIGAEHTSLNAKLADEAGKTIEVTGEVHQGGGLKVFEVASWKPTT